MHSTFYMWTLNSINRSHDNNQCNANNLNNNHFDLTNDTAPSTKQPLISRVNPSVPLVNVNSLNDLNKNDFNKNALDHTNDAALHPQQPLVPNQLSSASQINEVSTTQQKNSDNKHQKEQRKSNKDSDKNDHVSSIKSSIPCPFLIHRNRCVKGNRCDYKHPEKSSIPCPFLKKRGYCLKENKCDFSHDIPLDNDPSPRPYFGSHANTDPFLSHRQAPMLRQINQNPRPPSYIQNYHFREPWRNPHVPVQNAVMEFPPPMWSRQPIYSAPHPRPLMEIPVHPRSYF